MQGFGFRELKKHPYLIPIYLCVAVVSSGACFMAVRTVLRSPDVALNRKENPEPWQEYANKQYKFFSPIREPSEFESKAPKY